MYDFAYYKNQIIFKIPNADEDYSLEVTVKIPCRVQVNPFSRYKEKVCSCSSVQYHVRKVNIKDAIEVEDRYYILHKPTD